jgi:hypothetical protein
MFELPKMPLDVEIWHSGSDPATDPPDVETVGNLAWGKRTAVPSTGGTSDIGIPLFTMTLLLPKLTDIRGDPFGNNSDTVGVPSGSGRLYLVAFVDDLGKGFDNEHRGAILQQILPWPVPIP